MLDQLVTNTQDLLGLRVGQRIHGESALLNSVYQAAFEQAGQMVRHVRLREGGVLHKVSDGPWSVTQSFQYCKARQIREAPEQLCLDLKIRGVLR